MQGRGGYSLVEVVLVIGIMSILLAIGTIKYKEYAIRYRTEAQTRMLHSELQKARISAVYQKRGTLVKLFPGRLEVYSSTWDDTVGVAPVLTRRLEYPITCNGDGDRVTGYRLDFDSKGLPGNWCSICVDDNDGVAVLDSVIISASRLSMGKRDQGHECKAAHITIR
ncbi:MAG: hypothetical protein A2075_06745 [Geobacteraceae bacterium GWC2_58_44]|nr:MAG: hypothetical protein A2075_06745 [Geobacteraceae bacterium GWC2_58_44]HBG08253.1 pilus assembly protein PylG [Geobacter sp.]